MNLLFDYIVALTNLNGIIDKDKIIEIYNMQNETGRTIAEIESLMINNKEGLREHFVEVKDRYFVHEAIITFEEIETLLQRKADKPYYIPEKKLLLCYKDDEFYEETKQTKKLYRFLEKYVHPTNVNSVEDVFYEVLIHCEMEDQPIETINRLNQIDVKFPTEKELTEALNLIVDLSNHTRLWSNNGFTPAEMFEKFEKPYLKPLPDGEFDFHVLHDQIARPKKKVGRNDPCPCGSGEKYKKCCLLKA